MSSCRLPKLDLPEFSGDILFWHQFQSNIDSRNIPEVDKLLYLKAAIKGDAKRVIEGLETTNKNYNIAVRTLKERYGNSTYLIDAHYTALSKVNVASMEVVSCRKTLDDIERHLRVLGSLGEDVNHNHLRHLIFSKFPEDLIYELKLKLANDSIEEIRKQLELILSAREDANRITHNDKSKGRDNYTVETLHAASRRQPHYIPRNINEQPNRRFRPFNKNEDLKKEEITTQRKRPFENRSWINRKGFQHGGEGPSSKKKRLLCSFCEGNHYSDRCAVYSTITERKSRLKGKCFRCLSKGHVSFSCPKKYICYYCKSYGSHNRALCPTKFPEGKKTQPRTPLKVKTNTLSAVNDRKNTVLQTAVVTIRKEHNDAKTSRGRILFDSGSQRSYVTRRIVKELNLSTENKENLSVYTFGSKIPQEFESPVVKLELITQSGEGRTIYANVVATISNGVPYVEALKNWSRNEVLADDGSLTDQIDILIGNDYYYSFLQAERKQLGENLYLVNSVFGWITSGQMPCREEESMHMSVVTYFQTSVDFKLNKPDIPLDQGNISSLWELESIGITDSPKITREEEAIRNFNETTKLVNNRYYVRWPWTEYPPELSSNYGLAYGRLTNLIKRLDKETLQAYDSALQEQIAKGIIEEVDGVTEVNHPTHYLPFHGVAQKGKPIRIVYDASSKIKGKKSLNECLYCGPLMLEDLTCMLIRFRSHNIALSADVEKAFLQIGLQEQDRDVTRFLWVKNIGMPPTKDNLICLRFCRVPFGVISSPFLLNATVKHHLSKGSELVQQASKDIYVDNLVTGTETLKEALQLYKETKEAFQEISMNLREWSSNCKQFMDYVPDKTKEEIVKILGLDWCLEEDTLNIRFKLSTETNTKREALKVIASVYDPCGFVVPYTLSAKLFIQELWQSKVDWDTPFSEGMVEKWSEIRKELENVRDITIPRCYIMNVRSKDYHLHCFTDASLKAYAAVIYVTNGTKRSFVIGKTRLVPTKDQEHLKIPRLELLGVLIGCRLIKMVMKAFNMEIGCQTLWTDSQIVIEWCQSNKLLPPFIARRVEEIRRNKELMIKYVPSEMNPADVATKPMSSSDEKEKWIQGPQFISDSPNAIFPNNNTSQAFLFSAREVLPNVPEDVEHREISSLREEAGRAEDQETGNEETFSITEKLKKLQAEYFTLEVAGKETDLSRNLKLFKDIDGILRCKGRLQNSDLLFDGRYPILIPKECEFTNKLIEKTHGENYHVGVSHTLSLIRQKYWIPQGRTQVQKILRKCSRCVKHRSGPFKLPPTPALPAVRANYSKPFTFIGIDYMGPVLTNTGQKRWICLFTCLAVRAVHLEVVGDLSAEEGLLAVRRMVATRTTPKLVMSDNATHFRLIAEILSKPYCKNNEIQWKFIPQLAPWYGGFYERLIGIVKDCMKRTLGKHLLSDNQLTTVTKEIEAVMNTRPLTSVDAELDVILRPIDFLTPGKCITLEGPEGREVEKDSTIKVNLIESWKRGQVILREYKEMFVNRYLLSLRERYQHSKKEPRVVSKLLPAVGQVVQLKGDNKNRETWKVGRIISLKEGNDGLCRVAVVRVGKKDFTRSIAHLYPLEIQNFDEGKDGKSGKDLESGEKAAERRIDSEIERTKTDVVDRNESDQRESNSSKVGESGEVMSISRLSEPTQENVCHNESGQQDSNSSEEILMLEDPSGEHEREEERVPNKKRVAAIKAREKIREWTANLYSLISFA